MQNKTTTVMTMLYNNKLFSMSVLDKMHLHCCFRDEKVIQDTPSNDFIKCRIYVGHGYIKEEKINESLYC